jgi:Zn-dependent M28 family amino/carboxypeptidase
MRSFLYDVGGGPTLKLFHNNTVRTIAPEYEWAATPDGSRVLIVSDRDGDTVSPERGVYLVDLTTRVTVADVRDRLLEGLAAEEDLQARGRAAFAPVADVVAPVAEAISVTRIHEYARDVYAFGSKYIGKPGNVLAIDYYVEALRSFGYEPELQWFEPQPGVRSANVIARVPGAVDPELVYVVSSHFDSEEESPGADDNSSGSTALLEVARLLASHPMPASVELAFLTGEEAGLLGAREYVRRAVADGKHIVGILNNDMVGWANDHRLDNTIRYSNPGIRDIQHAAAMRFSRLITYDSRYYQRTDAAAFYDAYGDIVGGIGSYPVLGNPHYHQSTDRLETINHELVAEVARTTLATVMLLASSPARVTGLEVGGGSARWEASPETGVRAYEVRWQTADGWASAEVSQPRASLPGLVGGGAVEVRALHERGTVGWDWARAR